MHFSLNKDYFQFGLLASIAFLYLIVLVLKAAAYRKNWRAYLPVDLSVLMLFSFMAWAQYMKAFRGKALALEPIIIILYLLLFALVVVSLTFQVRYVKRQAAKRNSQQTPQSNATPPQS